MQTNHAPERPREPDPIVPQLLEQLIPHLRCDGCGEPVSPFEMLVIWPLVNFTAHLACYVEGQSLANLGAS